MGSSREELGERLETVRAETGLSLRAFWLAVVGAETDEGPFDWSAKGDGTEPRYGYRTVTRYHRGERAAPVDYLSRIAEVFDVRIKYLVKGSGSVKRPPWRKGFIHHALFQELGNRNFFEAFPLHTLGDKWSFLDLHRLYEISGRRSPGPGPGPLGGTEVEFAEDLRFLLRLPLIAWGYGHVREVPHEYWRGVMGGLQSAVGHFLELQPRESRKLRKARENREEPFVREFRKTYEGEEVASCLRQ